MKYRVEWWSVSGDCWNLDEKFDDPDLAIEFAKEEADKGNEQRVMTVLWSNSGHDD